MVESRGSGLCVVVSGGVGGNVM